MRQHISHDSPWLKSGVLSAHYLNEYHEEAEMSQAENAAATSLKPKREYRKGSPLSTSEKQKLSVARKRATHKEVKVFLKPEHKNLLMRLCREDGVTQAELLTELIMQEASLRNIT